MTLPTRFAFALAAALLAAPAGASTEVAAPYQVVLADGRVVPARTRPTLAFGSVSFLDGRGALATLPASAVDLDATRQRLPPPSTRRVWDSKALQAIDPRAARLNVAGGEGSDSESAVAPLAVDPMAHLTPEEKVVRMQAEIERLDGQVAALPATDRQVMLLRARQREIRDEMAALSMR